MEKLFNPENIAGVTTDIHLVDKNTYGKDFLF